MTKKTALEHVLSFYFQKFWVGWGIIYRGMNTRHERKEWSYVVEEMAAQYLSEYRKGEPKRKNDW
jgi:hypothetical protein